ncbi:hypothetical protein M8J76_005241 [Diaphorina citri]|nr:hypothetical protein M8J76_005241 [Diaphorina citri]
MCTYDISEVPLHSKMKAAWNKLTQKGDKEPPTPSGLQTLPANLQKKYSKGVQYNMKVVIKGDHNVGKTCLFERLQGLPFTGEYQETAAIQIAAIQWNYKNTDDVVKVEIWDIVDKAKKRVLQDKLKTENSGEGEAGVALDAEFINVYKGTNGVILIFDITKKWTFDYVQKEMDKIPGNIPVLILGNRCDQAHHRAVGIEEPKYYIENLNRPSSTRYAEASMYNSFGLKFLYKWFNLPFLQLQRETLLGQLETNTRETDVTAYELDVYEQTDESNYDLFLEKLSAQRRSKAEQNSNIPTFGLPSPSPSGAYVPPSLPGAPGVRSPPRVTFQGDTPSSQGPGVAPVPFRPILESVGRGKPIVPGKSPMPSASASSVPPSTLDEPPSQTPGSLANLPAQISALGAELKLVSVEDFVPDDADNVSKMFLADSGAGESQSPTVAVNNHEDSDSDTGNQGNPLVAGFQDEVEPHDYVIHPQFSYPARPVSQPSSNGQPALIADNDPSSSDEEELKSHQFSCSQMVRTKRRRLLMPSDDLYEPPLMNFRPNIRPVGSRPRPNIKYYSRVPH